ncbi:GAF domain-containing protein [Hugenholtzia roseola]|uniref:GAF domain-containing protein n=1 Tax=Hugenholtzia roseola TaxID=1002 RepID=UPI00047C643A|nr:GAF domain-containing protein [Hugenholtzia roseola]
MKETAAASNKISLNSVQGRMRLTFWVLVGISALMLLMASLRLNLFYRDYKQVQKIRQLKYAALQLRSSLNESFTYINLYVQYEDYPDSRELYLRQALQIFNTKTKTALANLQAESEDLSMMEIKRTMDKIIEKYKRFDKDKGEPLREYIKLDVVSLVVEFNKISDLYIDEQHYFETQAQTQLMTHVSNTIWWFIPPFGILSIIAFFLGRNATSLLKSELDEVRRQLRFLKKGVLPDSMPTTRSEFNALYKEISALSEKLRGLKSFAENIGKRDFLQQAQIFQPNSDLGEALGQMRERLQQVAQQEQTREWESRGLARISKVVRRHSNNLTDLCDKFLESLLEYLESTQGGVFIEKDAHHLELKATYAYGRKKWTQKLIETDEGLIGEAYKDGNTIVITDVPQNYLEITSGLGKANPAALLIVPLKNQERIVGVLEISSFNQFEPHQIRLTERLAEVLASAIIGAANSERMHKLLDEAQINAQQMISQEEELRQNTEELLATREELERQLESMRQTAANYAHIFANNACGMFVVDASGIIVEANESAHHILGFVQQEKLQNSILGKYIPGLRGLNRHYQQDEALRLFNIYEAIRRDRTLIDIEAMVSRIVFNEDAHFVIIFGRKAERKLSADDKTEVNLSIENPRVVGIKNY